MAIEIMKVPVDAIEVPVYALKMLIDDVRMAPEAVRATEEVLREPFDNVASYCQTFLYYVSGIITLFSTSVRHFYRYRHCCSPPIP
jgi:hypothetical protein